MVRFRFVQVVQNLLVFSNSTRWFIYCERRALFSLGEKDFGFLPNLDCEPVVPNRYDKSASVLRLRKSLVVAL